jgi:sec-independent protein translocase protein TatA
MNLGAPEIILILIVVLFLFGGKRLPELARGLGKGISEFRRATQEIKRDLQAPLDTSVNSQSTHSSENSSEPAKTSLYAHPAAQPRTSEKPSEPNP